MARFDRGIAQPSRNVAQRCNRVDISRPQRRARRTIAPSTRRLFLGTRVERASVQFVSRCDGETSTRPRRCAAFAKRCAMTQSTRRFAAAAFRAPH
eukprot:7321511-Lingulodinium_polyedra.AAC.1